jgi:Protein of unknown function (DUF2478)
VGSQREEIAMTPAQSRIAAVMGHDRSILQALLAGAVAHWQASGARIVGLLAEPHGLPDRACGAGILRDVVSGRAYPIYLETPPSHGSCHIDAAGVDAACAALLDQIPRSDLVVLSKFGKLEAAQSGLVGAFRAAIAAGKPVLTTLSVKQQDAWRAFAPDSVYLAADGTTLRRWWRSLAVTA